MIIITYDPNRFEPITDSEAPLFVDQLIVAHDRGLEGVEACTSNALVIEYARLRVAEGKVKGEYVEIRFEWDVLHLNEFGNPVGRNWPPRMFEYADVTTRIVSAQSLKHLANRAQQHATKG